MCCHVRRKKVCVVISLGVTILGRWHIIWFSLQIGARSHTFYQQASRGANLPLLS